MSEKQGLLSRDAPLLPAATAAAAPQGYYIRSQDATRRFRLRLAVILSFFSLALLIHNIELLQHQAWIPKLHPIVSGGSSHGHGKHAQCAQVDPLFPSLKNDNLTAMEEFLLSSEFQKASIERLSGIVQIPSVSYDDLGPIGEDSRWEIFFQIADYLKETFPMVHSHLKVDTVNTHGLVYTWQGSNEKLKPTILMAHQDVVPVAQSTIKSWTHPPFSGYFDGKYIWGRGSSDCKNLLIAELEAVESLLHAGFTPARTLVLSFGFDEEISGREGAGHLSKFLLDRHGKDAFAAILDEGAGINPDVFGAPMATPGTGEKGYIDVEIIVRMPGGHSSIPPEHNGIGVMSELITKIEGDQYEPSLDVSNPFLGQLYCGAEHAPNFPKKVKNLLPHGKNQCPASAASHKHKSHGKKDKLAEEVAKMSRGTRFLMQTSIAVDVINGGVKVNALPERTVATVNHRINIGESSSNVRKKLTKLAGEVSKKYGLALHAFNTQPGDSEPANSIILMAHNATLEPAPVTPTTLKTKDGKTTPFAILSGTTRALYNDKDTNVIVSPGIMTGNTDTRYYWDLSEHIFRYVPGWDPEEDGGLGNIHTVDERISVRAHVNTVRWVAMWIRNLNEADM